MRLSDYTCQVDFSKGFCGVKFTRTSPDGEQEYPGELEASASYLINPDNKLIMEWTARPVTAGCKTPVNMTNHTYWNLSGDFKDPTIANHLLNIDSVIIQEMDSASIPTGEFLPVAETPFDFRDGLSALGD